MRQHLAFAAFRERYPAQGPRIELVYPDEALRIADHDGLDLLDEDTTGSTTVPDVPLDAAAARAGRFLWVVGPDDLPYALEACAFGLARKRKLLKHTNLTGGDPAHFGGELWFLEDGRVIINGDSGRYGPRDMTQLRDAGQALVACGFLVGIVGQDALGNFKTHVAEAEEIEWL